MKFKSFIVLLFLFFTHCSKLKMPPVDGYIIILLSFVGIKKSTSPTNFTPTIAFSNGTLVFTQNLTIANITPILTGTATVTNCTSNPALPTGLSLDPTTCAISGTPTTIQTASTYIITATNSYGTGSVTILITVNQSPPSALTFATGPFTFTKDTIIATIAPTVTGTVTNCTSSPALPTGLSLDNITCAISGTPTTTQTATNYTITASNAFGSTTATIHITINLTPPSALTYSGSPYTMTNGVALTTITPTVTGTVTSCTSDITLPTGLSLDNSTCVISGIPTTIQTATNYVITATNSGGSTNATITITVNDAAPSALNYAGPYIFTKDATITSVNPTVTGTPTSYSITPALPTGLAINSTTGQLSGTPTVLSTPAITYTVTATNSGGSTTATITITVNDAAPSALSYAGTPFVFTKDATITSVNPTVTGTPTSYSITPALPTGLAINTTNGQLAGTPTILSTTATTYTVTATNSGGSTNATITITVNDAAPSALSYVGTPYIFTKDATITPINPTVTGTPTSYSITPALPTGLAINSTNGQLAGTPTILSTTATTYTVTATNSGGSTNTTITITVNDAAPSALSYVGTPFVFTKNVTITSVNPTVTGTPVSYSITPTLPTGLALNPTTGQLAGTPTDYGTATGYAVAVSYTITATNSGGSTTATISIAIATMRLHFPMSYTGGDTPSTVLDKSGFAANGTVNGGAVMGMDYTHTMGEAYKFDGVDDYISFSATNLPTGASARTICSWFKLAKYPTSPTIIIGYGTDSNNAGSGLAVDNLGRFDFFGYGGPAYDLLYTSPIIPGAWTHFCGSYDGTTAKLYINGQLKTSAAKTWNTTGTTGRIGAQVGATPNGYFNGNIDDVRIYGYALTDAEIKLVAAKVPNGLVAYYPLDGDATEVVGGLNATAIGSPSTTTDRYGNAGMAYLFNGSTQYLESAYNATLNPSTFTVSAWAKSNAAVANWGAVVASRSSVCTPGCKGYNFYRDDTTTLWEAWIGGNLSGNCNAPLTNGTSWCVAGRGNGSNANNSGSVWTHLVQTYDGTTFKFYINGALVQSGAVSFTPNTTAPLRIGALSDGLGGYFYGAIDDVRIYNRALSANEVAALGAEPEQGMVAWYPLDGNANDVVGGLNGTVVGATATTDHLSSTSSAYNLSGSSQYISIPHSATIKPTNAITYGGWFYHSNWSACTTNEVGLLSTTDGVGYSLNCFSGVLQPYVYRNGAWGIVTYPLSSISAGWHHIIVTYDGRYIKLYMDGVVVGANDAGAVYPIVQHASNPLIMGAKVQSGAPLAGTYFAGKIDDIRIHNRDLSAKEVEWLYSSDQFYYSDSPVLSKLISGTTQTPKDTAGTTTFSISPTLPTGLSINGSTGVISGIASDYGTAGGSLVPVNYTITAANQYGTTTSGLSLAVGYQPTFWLKADSGVYSDAGTTLATNGVAVQQWNDQSGNAAGLNVTQLTAANKPLFITNALNGKPVVRFDGVDDILSKTSVVGSSFISTNEGNFFFVHRENGTNAYNNIIDWNASALNNNIIINLARQGNTMLGDFGNYASGGRITVAPPLGYDNAFHIVELFRNTSTVDNADGFWMDGKSLGSGNYTSNLDNTPTNTLSIGSYTLNPAAGYNFTGDAAEIIIFNRALTSSERKQVQCYLAGKYAITVSGTCP